MRIPQEEWLLRLYVSGRGWLTSRAETNLERLCRQYLKGRYPSTSSTCRNTRRLRASTSALVALT